MFMSGRELFESNQVNRSKVSSLGGDTHVQNEDMKVRKLPTKCKGHRWHFIQVKERYLYVYDGSDCVAD